ncbi:MAG: hypothetical protein JWO37_406 [Acidimicrobiales bacterium]|nr:hypothetical protein [Acidimicrobiales bacterium]
MKRVIVLAAVVLVVGAVLVGGPYVVVDRGANHEGTCDRVGNRHARSLRRAG